MILFYTILLHLLYGNITLTVLKFSAVGVSAVIGGYSIGLYTIGGLLYKIPGLFILIPVSSYALCSSYFIQGIFKKYIPDEQKHEDEE